MGRLLHLKRGVRLIKVSPNSSERVRRAVPHEIDSFLAWEDDLLGRPEKMLIRKLIPLSIYPVSEPAMSCTYNLIFYLVDFIATSSAYRQSLLELDEENSFHRNALVGKVSI
jgi:hypothetical protein